MEPTVILINDRFWTNDSISRLIQTDDNVVYAVVRLINEQFEQLRQQRQFEITDLRFLSIAGKGSRETLTQTYREQVRERIIQYIDQIWSILVKNYSNNSQFQLR